MTATHWNQLLSASLSGSDFDLATHGTDHGVGHIVTEPPDAGPAPARGRCVRASWLAGVAADSCLNDEAMYE
ncbi:hypothetical protein EVAR_13003_1 [Eumeta japonica]|uniref:Uncharacterized protein n=1 Tax=Eumeta variegata TaxID=151549 RepID=A0A4C1TWZ0_EUMVA|nr:hypothetical protein EVAR_13003_1 [Eumeta japonica]